MNVFGNAMLWLGLLAALVCVGAYLTAGRERQARLALGRAAFVVSALATLAASVLLLIAFIGSRFEVGYVASYSSRDLPLLYRVSAFWAGQEGSFLLWALMGAGIGLVLMRVSGAWERALMTVFAATQAFLFLLLAAKSPFTTPEAPLADGHGLNPLLQDPWMAIHPPMIFLGYAALAVPFAFAVAAMARREYDRWVAPALPWVLFAWVTLGAGIFIGGYWAYRVLGWGGYWGWDPVENASLIPWLLCTALLHGMLAQRARGTFKHANLLLAAASFVMVLYGTFLTRSGVLKDFSVHSFVDPGMLLYWTMLGGMILAALGAFALYLTRFREIQSGEVYDRLLTRDFAFSLGLLVLFLSAGIVTIGTSAPLITSLLASMGLAGAPAAVQPSFYNRTHFPVAVLLALLVAAAPLLEWRRNEARAVTRRLLPYLIAAAIGTAVAVAVGVRNGWMLLLVAASLLALAVSVANLARAARRPLHTGAPLSHIGLALMLVGIVGSSVYSRSQKLVLHPGKTDSALGYQVTYQGSASPTETRREMNLHLTRGSDSFTAVPYMVFSPQMNSWVHSPAVRKYWLQDLYLSPVELRQTDPPGTGQAMLGRGESLEAGGYTFTFDGFEMAGEMGDSGMRVGAVVQVKTPGGKTLTVKPITTVGNGGDFTPRPAEVPGTGIQVAMTGIHVPQVELAVWGLPVTEPAGPTEEAVVEVSIKPLINVLWLGSVLVLVGGLIAMARRAREARGAAKA